MQMDERASLLIWPKTQLLQDHGILLRQNIIVCNQQSISIGIERKASLVPTVLERVGECNYSNKFIDAIRYRIAFTRKMVRLAMCGRCLLYACTCESLLWIITCEWCDK